MTSDFAPSYNNRVALEKKSGQILEELCVEALYLFGSRAQKKESPLSDYDYAVLMPKTGYAKGGKTYFKLYELLTKISPRTLKNDVIDIIFLRDAGLELAFHVIRYGKVLYDNSPKARLAFEERTTLLYCDYLPLLNQFDRAILKSL